MRTLNGEMLNHMPAAFCSMGPLPRNSTKEMNLLLQMCSDFLLELGFCHGDGFIKVTLVPRAPSYPCLEDKGSQYRWKERLGGWDPHRYPVLKALSALDSTALTLEWGLETFKESVPRRGLCLPRESNCLTQGGVVLGTPENALLIFCHFNKLGS